jgi:uncharacterized integral membrane protein
MRFGWILLVLLFGVFGAAFGALNSQGVAFDFYFGSATLPKGAALLFALLCGWLLGGVLVYLGMVLRLRRRVAALMRQLKQHDPQMRAEPGPDFIARKSDGA